MEIHQETISFLAFIFIGALYGVIFDFFRAMRKFKKCKDLIVSIQDISYFVIVGIVLIFAINTFMVNGIRVYNILSIILGIIIYSSILGNSMVVLFLKILTFYRKIAVFIFTPLEIFRQIFSKQIHFFKNFVIKCCKKIFFVINFKHADLKKN